MTAPHHMGDAPMYLVLNIIGNKIGLDKIKADPASIKKKFGFMGEPMYIGLIVGLLLGVVGNIGDLNTMAACGSWGNNSISENLTYKHLMNTTRLAYYHDCTMPELDEVWKL